jgi:hypothetical protein
MLNTIGFPLALFNPNIRISQTHTRWCEIEKLEIAAAKWWSLSQTRPHVKNSFHISESKQNFYILFGGSEKESVDM